MTEAREYQLALDLSLRLAQAGREGDAESVTGFQAVPSQRHLPSGDS